MSIDLENFGNASNEGVYTSSSTAGPLSADEALGVIDDIWYTNKSREGRWMDLIGDYAGSEPFVIDGGFNFLKSDHKFRMCSRRITLTEGS